MTAERPPTGLTCALAATFLAFGLVPSARAWHVAGHERAARLATELAAPRLPDFFGYGAAAVAQASTDPDFFKAGQLEHLRDAERPEHYFDVELLDGADAPRLRSEFLDFCARRDLRPGTIGTLPYAVAEWTERLALAFAQHRSRPDDPGLRHKCLVYAGVLAHYGADLCMPLHLTVDFDGRVLADGTSPRSGIHERVDALPGKVDLPTVNDLRKGFDAVPFGNLFGAIMAQLHRTRDLVDTVYQLEAHVPPVAGPIAGDAVGVRAFAEERLATSSRFVAQLYITAWDRAPGIDLSIWEGQTRASTPPRRPGTVPMGEEE